MGFGRFRKLFRRAPKRQELDRHLTRGLDIERDYQTWIDLWEDYEPMRSLPRPVSPLSVLLVGSGSDKDRAYWGELANRGGGPEPIWAARSDAIVKEALSHAIRIASDFLMILRPSDRLNDAALSRFDAALNAAPGASLMFGDEDQIDASGRRFAPWFKPDFGEDLFLCQNGFGRAVVFRTSVLQTLAVPEAGELDDVIYDLALQTITATGQDPLHCPGILVHVAGDPAVTPKARSLHLHGDTRRAAVERFIARRPSLAGSKIEEPNANNFLRLRHSMPDPLPRVSIVIPTRDRKDLLEACVQSLDEKTNYPTKEIIILDNNSVEEATKTYLAVLSRRTDVRIIPAPGPFNYARLINLGASHARGELLMTLNNDVEAFEPDWLDELVSQVSRPGVGLVGCLLLYPDRTVQHAGVVMGLRGVAGYLNRLAVPGDAGYAGRVLVAQDLSAVTGACQIMRRGMFEQLGGYDERNLAVAYNDIDFCLRVRDAGMRVIYTPHARLLHRHSASRGSEKRPDRIASYAWEREYMRTRWGYMMFDDPFFNPNLSLSSKRIRLAAAPRARIFTKN